MKLIDLVEFYRIRSRENRTRRKQNVFNRYLAVAVYTSNAMVKVGLSTLTYILRRMTKPFQSEDISVAITR